MFDKRIEQLLQRELDQDLTPAEQQELTVLLEEFPDVRRIWHEYQSVDRLLQQLPPKDPPVSITDQVLKQLDLEVSMTEKPRNRLEVWFNWKIGLGVAATLLLMWGGSQWGQVLPKSSVATSSPDSGANQHHSQIANERASHQMPDVSIEAWSPDRTWRVVAEQAFFRIYDASGQKLFERTRPSNATNISVFWSSATEVVIQYHLGDQQKRFIFTAKQGVFYEKGDQR